MRRLWAVVLVGGLVMLAASPAAAASKHTVHGVIVLTGSGDDGWPASNTGCAGSSGYDDVTEGASVKLLNGKSNLVGIGHLSAGKLDRSTADSFNTVHECTFRFTMKGVPETKFYSVKIGNRGGPDYTLAEMKKAHWSLALSLGS